LSEYRYEPGPIAWPPLDIPAPSAAPGEFEDLLARAAHDSPDLVAAIDATQRAAAPNPGDTDAGDDQDLIDGAAELADAARRVHELRPVDELGALGGLSPEIDAGAAEVSDDDELPYLRGDDDLPRTPPEDPGPRHPREDR
jgi:hypothetical protein